MGHSHTRGKWQVAKDVGDAGNRRLRLVEDPAGSVAIYLASRKPGDGFSAVAEVNLDAIFRVNHSSQWEHRSHWRTHGAGILCKQSSFNAKGRSSQIFAFRGSGIEAVIRASERIGIVYSGARSCETGLHESGDCFPEIVIFLCYVLRLLVFSFPRFKKLHDDNETIIDTCRAGDFTCGLFGICQSLCCRG